MIVKNEEAVLSRCLESAKQVCDELVVVDTGSMDHTVAVASRYTDRIYCYEWCEDFSKARNFSFSKATCDYCMWLDADDVLSEKATEEIALLKALDFKGCVQFAMPYVTAQREDGSASFWYYRERIFLRGTASWQGFVHESVPWRKDIQMLSGGVLHKKERSSGERNLRIMKANGVLQSNDYRMQYYYCRELADHGLYALAQRNLEYLLRNDLLQSADALQASLLLGRIEKNLGKERRALDHFLKAMAYGGASAELCCEIGSVFLGEGRYALAVGWYERARSVTSLETDFVSADFSEFIPAIMLCVCYDKLGDPHKAHFYHKLSQKIYPKHPSVLHNEAYFRRLGF